MAKPMTKAFDPKQQGIQTKVTCAITGEKNFMMQAFCMFGDVDRMIGGKFERALAGLKTTIESTTK